MDILFFEMDDTGTNLSLVGYYDMWSVLLSLAIAVFASFMAFQVASQAVATASRLVRQVILLVSSIALGVGIWSMHFIGMLAFEFCTDITYDWYLTLLSLVPGVAASWVAQNLISRAVISTTQLLVGGLLVGAGIGSTYYIGMAAMEMAPILHYEVLQLSISILIAVALAILSLYTRFALDRTERVRLSTLQKSAISGLIMGIAISGMHYVGMGAARFTLPAGVELSKTTADNSYFIPPSITALTTAVIALVLVVNIVLKYKFISMQATESEKRLRAVMDTSIDVIVTLDATGKIISSNKAIEPMLGWSEEELIGKNINILIKDKNHDIHSDYMASHLKAYASDIAGTDDQEVEALTKSGELIPVRLGIGHIKSEKNGLFVAFISDLRKHVAMESELRENESRFRSILENIPGITYRCIDTPGRPILYMSDEVKNITGYPPEDFIAPNSIRNFTDFILVDDIPVFKDADLYNPDGYKLEYRIKDMHGNIKWMLSHGTFSSSENGKSGYFDGFIMDITSRKEIIQQLVIEKEKAEQAARTRAAFLSNMSHEIRTPMNAIVGFSDILLNDNIDNKKQEHIKTINQSAKSLMHLLNDILDSAKLDKGKLQLEYRDFSLTEEVDTVVSTLWIEGSKKNIDIELNISKDVKNIYNGAPDRIRQVLTNIIGNSIKFTHAGKIEVNVMPYKGEYIQFSVKDTGIGMTTEQLENIFDAFEQADESMSRKYGGTGLGTTISKQLVELMGGTIFATSDPNLGSTFTFRIPLKEVVKENSQLLLHKATMLPKLKILVADDIEKNIELLSILLGRLGHTILTARDGKQALARMESERPDIVLLDIHMPVMDGLTAARLRRSKEAEKKLPRVPMIALTASVLETDRLSANEAGIDGFANKPIDIFLLTTEIAKVLNIDEVEPEDDLLVKSSSVQTNIDIDIGLSLWGSKNKYHKEITLFVRNFDNLRDDLEDSLDEENWEKAEEICHSLKGLSGNLGLNLVMRCVDELEQALSNAKENGLNTESTYVKKENLYMSIKSVIHYFSDILENKDEENIGDQEITEDGLNIMLQRVIDLSEKNEIHEELLDSLSLLSESKYPEITAIIEAINEFNFSIAIAISKSCIEKTHLKPFGNEASKSE